MPNLKEWHDSMSQFRAMDRAYKVLGEAYRDGCSPYDCEQAFWLALDGIEPAPADEDYVHPNTNDANHPRV